MADITGTTDDAASPIRSVRAVEIALAFLVLLMLVVGAAVDPSAGTPVDLDPDSSRVLVAENHAKPLPAAPTVIVHIVQALAVALAVTVAAVAVTRAVGGRLAPAHVELRSSVPWARALGRRGPPALV